MVSLAGAAHWIECQSANQKVAGSVLIRAHAWVAGQVPGWGHVRGNQLMFLSHINVSLPLFLPPSLPLSLKVNKILKRNRHSKTCMRLLPA